MTDGVKKTVLYAGGNDVPRFADGSRVIFHFQCQKANENGEPIIVDDSKKVGKPMELIIGKQFKMPVWEECLKTMKTGERACFDVTKSLVDTYPLVSKSYRQFAGVAKVDERNRCCGMVSLNEGIGQSDLDQLLLTPCDLQFILELLKVEAPGEYEKESWTMTAEEKLKSIPMLKQSGNALYNEKKYKEASETYFEALKRLEQLILREKPGEEEWRELDKMKLPLLLNFAQCKLFEKDYYSVIEHTTAVLERDPDNVKALFRRAKGHIGAWNLTEAEKDYERLLEIDSSLRNVVEKEMKNLKLLRKQKDAEDRDNLYGKKKGESK